LNTKIFNFLLFQIGWFACILGAAHNHVGLGSVIAIACFVSSFWRASSILKELELLLKVLVIGILLDTLLIQFHLIIFKSNPWNVISPVWTWLLWCLFARTLNESLSWLKENLIFAAILGAALGPLSYVAGVELGAAVWVNKNSALVFLAICWAGITPLFVYWARVRA